MIMEAVVAALVVMTAISTRMGRNAPPLAPPPRLPAGPMCWANETVIEQEGKGRVFYLVAALALAIVLQAFLIYREYKGSRVGIEKKAMALKKRVAARKEAIAALEEEVRVKEVVISTNKTTVDVFQLRISSAAAREREMAARIAELEAEVAKQDWVAERQNKALESMTARFIEQMSTTEAMLQRCLVKDAALTSLVSLDAWLELVFQRQGKGGFVITKNDEYVFCTLEEGESVAVNIWFGEELVEFQEKNPTDMVAGLIAALSN